MSSQRFTDAEAVAFGLQLTEKAAAWLASPERAALPAPTVLIDELAAVASIAKPNLNVAIGMLMDVAVLAADRLNERERVLLVAAIAIVGVADGACGPARASGANPVTLRA